METQSKPSKANESSQKAKKRRINTHPPGGQFSFCSLFRKAKGNIINNLYEIYCPLKWKKPGRNPRKPEYCSPFVLLPWESSPRVEIAAAAKS
jgi:hypothetical protein